MKKLAKFSLIMLMLLCMGGCGTVEKTDEQPMTNIQVQKDGSVKHTIYEDFQETYYHVDELSDLISDYIQEFVKENQDAKIELISCELDTKLDGMVKVVMEYDSCDSYAKFNQVNMYMGTVEDAYEKGYDLNLYLERVNDKKKESIVKADLLKMGDKHILFTDENIVVHCYEDVMYATQQVTSMDKKTVVMEQTQGMSAIVFK